MRLSLKHRLEYRLLRAIAAPFRWLPYPVALGLGWLVAWLGHYGFRYRVGLARARLRAVLGPAPSPRAIHRAAWLSWRNTVFSTVEMTRLDRFSDAWLARHFAAAPALAAIQVEIAGGRGAVIATPHMGSWELGAVRCHRAGIPIFSLAARQKNPLTDAYINQLRRRPGIETLARDAGVARAIIARLRGGGVLAILPDVRKPTAGVPAPFLGGEANIAEGMAQFARQCDVPVIQVTITRHGWGRHRMELVQILRPDPTLDKSADIRRMTRLVMQKVDDAIRRDPAQWFWYNKRWILDPVENREGRAG